MREEIAAAVVFLTRLVKRSEKLSSEKVEEFSARLSEILVERFRDHWYTNTPSKGQAYRCIRITESEPEDPVLLHAARECMLMYRDLQLPLELTLWIDPAEVTCRFGERKGSICTVASFKNGAHQNHAHSLDISTAISHHQHARMADFSKLQLIMKRRSNNRDQPPVQQYSPASMGSYHGPGTAYHRRESEAQAASTRPTHKHSSRHFRKNGYNSSHPHVAAPGRGRRDRFHWVKVTQQPVNA